MDVATSTISNIIAAGVPHAANEARRDSLARETIPQISQNSATQNSLATSQGAVQTAPANTNLYIQADSLIKTGIERTGFGKKDAVKSAKKESGSDSKTTKAASSASSTVSGNSLNQNVEASAKMNASLGGSFGSNGGASYSKDAEQRRKKGEGFSPKAIANAYNASEPRQTRGNYLDVSG
ncbi:MAG: hypothetical protein ACI4UM_09340 [Succinivibrio sp.]